SLVAKIVEENSASPQAFRHFRDVTIRAVLRHLCTHGLRKHLGLIPIDSVGRARLKRRHNVQALSTRRPAEGHKTKLFEPHTQLFGGGYYICKRHIGSGVEIEYETARR